ncbi:MAG: flagellar biosynthesis protein FlhA [Deltaproteobacteria bacterium]|nr:flagellar biosynthesis protein FlhA [Deltaproteobacteria bacterium]
MLEFWKRFANQSELFLAAGVVMILGIMVIPMPPVVMDTLLFFNIAFSLVILLVAIYTERPLDFSIFPSILLMTTLYRLSLNVASTRLILLHGGEGTKAAGNIIQAFGTFVVGGNYVVGMVVFLILVIINFVVITKGAGRIAEVGARFTLDALPGKQMSIDADLNAGLINEAQARQRRKDVEMEADFYGAMDGASKFVRGDAIAGIIITIINILGGLVIGVLQQHLSVTEAAQTYTLLTVGDGLVSQLPALIVSTAAGLVVTHASTGGSLGVAVIKQLFSNTRAIAVTAGIMFLLGLIPGLPQIPFLFFSVVMGGGAYLMHSRQEKTRQAEEEEAAAPPPPEPERIERLLPLDLLEMEIGYGLIPLVDRERGGDLLERIRSVRRQFATEMGIIVPPLHIRDNLKLKAGEYAFRIKGEKVDGGELMMNHLLAMDGGNVKDRIRGMETTEPAFGLPALWVNEQEKDRAKMSGYSVVDHSTVIATHLTEMIRKHAEELLGRQEVQSLLDHFGETYPKVVEELVPNLLSLGAVQKVLQNLLSERISIRDLRTILETLADHAEYTKDTDLLTEYVRQKLGRSITRPYMDPAGELRVITLDQQVEDQISESITRHEQGTFLALDPVAAQKVISRIGKAMEKAASMNIEPVLLCSPGIRMVLRKMTERFLPDLVVLSHSEVSPNTKIQSVESVRI